MKLGKRGEKVVTIKVKTVYGSSNGKKFIVQY